MYWIAFNSFPDSRSVAGEEVQEKKLRFQFLSGFQGPNRAVPPSPRRRAFNSFPDSSRFCREILILARRQLSIPFRIPEADPRSRVVIPVTPAFNSFPDSSRRRALSEGRLLQSPFNSFPDSRQIQAGDNEFFGDIAFNSFPDSRKGEREEVDILPNMIILSIPFRIPVEQQMEELAMRIVDFQFLSGFQS